MSARSHVPYLTLSLIAASILAAFAFVVNPEIAFEYGFRPEAPSVLSAFTSLFLHANLVHLLGNMVFLAAVGAAVELATGTFRFGLVYLLGGLAGVLAYYLTSRELLEPAPLVGASGSIAACAGYYSFRYTGLRVPVAPKRSVTVLAVTLIWFALQIVGAYVNIGDVTGGLAFWAHIGGFLAGVLLSFVFRAPDLGDRRLGHAVLDLMNERGPGAVVHAALEHLRTHPGDHSAMEKLADAYEQLGDVEDETKIRLQLIEDLNGDAQAPHLARLIELGAVKKLPSTRRSQLADRMLAIHPGISKRLLQSIVDGPRDDAQIPDAMLALAALLREEEPEASAHALRDLAQRFPLHPATELARTRGWLP